MIAYNPLSELVRVFAFSEKEEGRDMGFLDVRGEWIIYSAELSSQERPRDILFLV